MSNRDRGSYLGCGVVGIALGAIAAVSGVSLKSMPGSPLTGLLALGVILVITNGILQMSLEKTGTLFIGFGVGLILTAQYAL